MYVIITLFNKLLIDTISPNQYLKANFQCDVDICKEKYLKPYIKDYILKEIIYYDHNHNKTNTLSSPT